MRQPLEMDAEALQEAEREIPHVSCKPKDKYSLDIDKDSRRVLLKRFPNWEEALKSANEVLIDEMLTLLELHYEDLAKNKQKKRSKAIFGSIAFAHRKQLNQKLVLPQRVKRSCDAQRMKSR